MSRTQPVYTKEFKQQAVELFKTSGKSKSHIARDLGISDSALNKWCKEFEEQGQEAFPGKGHQTAIEEENRKLKREVEILRQERDILKSGEHLRAAPTVKFRFIHEHRQEFPIVRMCQVLEVSEKGYASWRKRGVSQRKRDDERITVSIEDAYYHHRGHYGSPRIYAELKGQGISCGRRRVARLMQENQLSARKKRRKVRTTDSNHQFPIAPNLLEQDFTASAPNKKWLTDFTYIDTREGWIFLAGVLDAYSRKIVGWSMSEKHDAELVKTALRMALIQRHPGADLVHHSDRGSEYASTSYQTLLREQNIQASMSKKVIAMIMP